MGLIRKNLEWTLMCLGARTLNDTHGIEWQEPWSDTLFFFFLFFFFFDVK